MFIQKSRILRCIILAAAAALLLSACTSSAPPEDADIIKINYTSASDFMSRYGNYIQKQIPGIAFEVIPNARIAEEESLAAFVAKHELDIVWMDHLQYFELVQAGALQPLDAESINGFDMIPEAFMSQFKHEDGRYYGIPTDFLTHAIFYNTDMFDEHQVPYPESKMTWDEVIALAGKFPNTWGANAFYGGPAEYVLQNMAITLGGGIYSDDMRSLLVNSEPWRKAWLMTADAYVSKAFHESRSGFEEFTIGRTAMFYSTAYAIDPMRKKAGKIPVGLTAQPVHPDKRDTFPFFHVNVYGIGAAASFPEHAWEVIRMLDELTFLATRGNVPSRVTAWEEQFNIDFSPIYALHLPKPELKPEKAQDTIELTDNWEEKWRLYIGPIMERNMQQTFDGFLTAEQSYDKFVREAEAEWQKFIEKFAK